VLSSLLEVRGEVVVNVSVACRAFKIQGLVLIAFTDASRIFTFSPTAVFTVTVFLLLILLGTVHMDYADFSF